MQVHLQILEWQKNGQQYKDGVLLYHQFGDDETLKDLFSKFQSPYFENKLHEELTQIKNDSEINTIIEPEQIKKPQTIVEKLPDKLIAMEREKANLFKQILAIRTEIKKHLSMNFNGRISMKDALAQMRELDRFNRLRPFNITYISYNKGTGKGGEVLVFKDCYLRMMNKSGTKVMQGTKFYKGKQPDHWKNSTRNFVIGDTKQIRSFHIWLLIEFNGMEVVTSELG